LESAETSASGVTSERGAYEIAGLPTEDLFRALQFAGPGADAQTLKESNVELRIGPAVEVAAGWRDATLPLKHPKVLGCYR
jgi:hypothetical protein